MRVCLAVAFLLGLSVGSLTGADEEKSEKPKEVAGKADVMRHVVKRFASFEGVEEGGRVRLQLKGEDESSTWPMREDAEVKFDGWWGRLEQFRPGDRVWAWFAVNRKKEPVSVLMLANEVSEMDIHGQAREVTERDGEMVTFRIPGEKDAPARTLRSGGHDLEVGNRGFVQSAGGAVRRFLTEAELETARAKQRDWLRERWREEGLPGMVSFLHPLSGEMEVFLDHEGRRWGRHLENGARVTLVADRDLAVRVKFTEPWREKTRVRLVTKSGLDQLDLSPGQRIALRVPEPPAEVQASPLPTDIGRLEGRDERIEWFLSTVYCTCGIDGDRCTGMFYTLAACNVNSCGGPNDMREILAAWMEEGMDDRAIFERLREKKGRDVRRPHLLR